MMLDRLPHGGIRRVVDDHHAFEIRPVELGHAVERLAQHLRRLAAGRNVDRDERRQLRQSPHALKQPRGLRPEHDGGKLLDALLHDHDERDEESRADEHGDLRAEHEIMRDPIIDDIRRPSADRVGGKRDHGGLRRGHARDGEDGDRQQQADGERGQHLEQEVRRFDVAREGEFRMAIGVEHAPIGTDASLVGLPRLVERLDDRIVDAHGVGARDEVADDLGLDERTRHRVLAIESRGGPAELGDDDALAGIGLPQLLVGMHCVIDRG